MKTFDYAGKSWPYDDLIVFQVEIGRYQNSYRIHAKYPHTMLSQAISAYEGMNVSDGYKKRLVMVKNGIKTKIIHKTSKGVRK